MADIAAAPYVLPLALTCVATFALAVTALLSHDQPAAGAFGMLCLLLAAWTATTAAGLLTTDPGTSLFLERLQWAHAVVVPTFWLTFALKYTGYGPDIGRRELTFSVAPTIPFAVLLLFGPETLVWSSYEFVEAGPLSPVDETLGPLTLGGSLYAIVLTLVGGGTLARFGLASDHSRRDQTVTILVGVATPLVVSMFWFADVTPLRGLNVTSHALLVSAVAFGNAMFRHGLLETAPLTRQFGQQAITENVRDGVLVVDDRSRVVECNHVAGRALGVDPTDAVGRDVGTILHGGALADDGLERDPARGGSLGRSADLTGAADGRQYAVDRSPVRDRHGDTVGRVYVLRDITDVLRREERLAVLNRVLRHNLRNDMNVVDGHARDLARRLEGQDADAAATISDVATNLVELSHKARTMEGIMATDGAGTRSVAAVVDGVVDDCARPATVDVDVPDVAVANVAVVEAVLANLVENAVEHAGDEPVIAVEGRDEDGVVELVVADDGPGIPEGELDVVRRGEESPLEHGSGLGLWLVTWGVERLGGDIAIEVDDGTTVTVTLPAARRGDAGEPSPRRPGASR